jgi:thiol-disulfide isomerase/thioredoxin
LREDGGPDLATRHVTFPPLMAKSRSSPREAQAPTSTESRPMPTRLVVTIIAVAVMAVALSFEALARQPYDTKAFEQAQAAGKTILIDVFAPWCPVCKKQQPIIGRLEKDKPGLVVYALDFDRDKAELKKFGVNSQSTLIVFKGAKEVGRSTGETDPARIEALVSKGL